jgi:N-acetylglucosamine malate deacetylase 1
MDQFGPNRYHPGMDTIVLIFPHPDDDACGMGGTALLLKDRFTLHSICLTRGDRGLGPDPSAETAAMREKEQRECSRLLGSQIEFLGATDGEVFADRGMCEQVAARLADLSPRAIFTTFPMENHPDHAACADIATMAARIAGIYPMVEIYQAEEGLGSQTMSFDPHIFVDISSVIEEKKRLVRCHACQNPNDSLCTEVVEQARFRGRLALCEYAEAWRSYFPIVSGGRGWGPIPILLET